MHVLCMTQPGEILLWINGLHTHFTQQSPDALDIIVHSNLPQLILHTQYTQGWIIGKQPVHGRHQPQVFPGLAHTLVVHTASRHIQQFTLAADAQCLRWVHIGFSLVHSPVFFKLFFKKSFSTFSWPI